MSSNRYTEGDYLEKNPTWHSDDSPWKAGQIMKMITRHHLQPRTVCEVGCGAGDVLRNVHIQLGPSVLCEGFEISPQAYELARKIGNDRLCFFHEDFARGERPVQDLVLVIDVVEHVEDCFGFLRRLLPRGRQFIFHFPLDLSAQSILRNSPIMRLRQTVGHVHYFTQDTVLALLQETGYQVRDHFYTPTDLALPPQSWKASLARWPRRLIFAWNQDLAVRLSGGFSLLVLADGKSTAP